MPKYSGDNRSQPLASGLLDETRPLCLSHREHNQHNQQSRTDPCNQESVPISTAPLLGPIRAINVPVEMEYPDGNWR